MTVKKMPVELDFPVRPFAVGVPRVAGQFTKEVFTAVVYGDTHFPVQDDRALSIVKRVVQETQPDVLVHIGDLLDCYGINRFLKDPYTPHHLQHEIDMARVHLHEMSQLAPHARKVLYEGNHEDRLRKSIWDMYGGAGALAQLTAFRENLTWPALLGLDQIGWEFIPWLGQTRSERIIPLLVKHGTIVRSQSGRSAKGEYDKHGTSGISGHTHRQGIIYHRDERGPHAWTENGCTCLIDPEYAEHPDWQQGFTVITFTEPDEMGSNETFGLEPVTIHRGTAMFRGRVYRA